MNIDEIFCPYCGNRVYVDFIIQKDIRICTHCGAAHYIANRLSEHQNLEKNRLQNAYDEIKQYNFGNARSMFLSLIQNKAYTSMSIAAKWGYLLAKYGIIYITNYFKTDEKTGEYPIEPIYCFPEYSYHRIFTEEDEYRDILDSLPPDSKERQLYVRLAENIQNTIDRFKKSISDIENDIFICVKINQMTRKTPGNQAETSDFKKAKALYRYLTEQCHKKVFLNTFPRETTNGTEMTVFPNLLQSKKMLLISSKEEYLSEVAWIKNDWMRWLYLDDNHMRKNNLLIYIPGEHENPKAECPHELQSCSIYTDATYGQLVHDLCHGTSDETAIQKMGSARSLQFQYSLPYGIKTVSRRFFEKDQSLDELVELTLPNSVTKIEADTFHDCTNLEKLCFGDHVKEIGNHAFLHCPKLKIIFDGTRKAWENLYQAEQGHYREIEFLKKDGWIYYENQQKSPIPYEVTGIADHAYDTMINPVRITKVEFHDRIKTIGEYAFAGCEDLEEIILPQGVVKIGRNAFFGCKNLKRISLPDTLTSIDSQAFARCERLISITLPDSVTNIGTMAFSECRNLINVRLPKGIKSVAPALFRKCSMLATLYLPDSVTSIGEFAFYECSSLSNFTLPKNISVIARNTFGGCVSLNFLQIPEGVSKIEEFAFSHWHLPQHPQTAEYAEMVTEKSIIIPSSVQTIEPNAFFDSDDLFLQYNGTQEQWDTLGYYHANVYCMKRQTDISPEKEKNTTKKKSSSVSGAAVAILILLVILAISALCVFLLSGPFSFEGIIFFNDAQTVTELNLSIQKSGQCPLFIL
ncbi:MAG: leucine-rich repeat protein [Clostridia bacterium]|nr:leucine-rich repeat protein [Clostridia bacterium]